MSEPKFSKTFEKLLETTVENLYFIVHSEEVRTREQAIIVKQKITLRLGVLNSRYNLQSNSNQNFKKRKED